MESNGNSDITYVTTYYNEPELLESLLENFVPEFFSNIIIVDDGSQQYPAEPIVRKNNRGMNITLLRVKDDLGFNSHGCRNLAMQHVKTGWAYLTDIDMYTDLNAAFDLYNAVQESSLKQYFTFWRGQKQDYIGRCEEGCNDFCIRVEDFWESYGYDEEYTGIHYGDKMYQEKLNSYMVRTLLPNIIIDQRGSRRSKMTTDVDITTYDNENRTMLHPYISDKTIKEINDRVGYRNETRELWPTKSVVDFEWEQII